MASDESNKISTSSSGKLLPFLTEGFLDFRRIWLLTFILTAGFAIVPVIFFAAMDYNLTFSSMEQEAVARTSRLASNTWRSVAFFLDERKNALTYVVNNTPLDRLSDPARLSGVLESLSNSFGGFTDIGVIDDTGTQVSYAGPYKLEGKNYAGQTWFSKVMEQGSFVSEVFMGYRHVPHISIAIRHQTKNGRVFILRATMEHQLTRILSQVDKILGSDVFLVNTQGILQTRSGIYGEVLDLLPVTLPPKTDKTQSFSLTAPGKTDNYIAAYRYIPNTPFILMVVKSRKALMAPWHDSRITLLKYLSISITVIVVWIWWITTFLVERLKRMDRKRAKYFHMAEYANKMASIGRLAAGVAHEINNPLAIINEKAGLMKDLLEFQKEGPKDLRFEKIISTILESVVRCSRITRQLLSFGRQTGNQLQPLGIRKVLDEVLVFLGKEAEFRNISLNIAIPETIPQIVCDRGKLQQVLLNIINNAFAAMEDGGQHRIKAQECKKGGVVMAISDDGCGISDTHLKEIFDPFFSTKTAEGGTGLGLSITYGLVQELGGQIRVKSRENKGTTFTVLLPLAPQSGKEE